MSDIGLGLVRLVRLVSVGVLSAGLTCASWSCVGSQAGSGNLDDPSTKPDAQDIQLGDPIALSDVRIGVMGRGLNSGSGFEMGYPGVTVRVCFTGGALSVIGSSNKGRSRFAVIVNDTRVGEFTLPITAQEVAVWRAPRVLKGGHTCVDLVHQTETWIGVATLSAVRVAGELVQSDPFPERKLLFVGDSVTCGEAVIREPTCSKDHTWWDAFRSYGAQAAQTLRAQYQLVCYGGRGLLRDWQGRQDTLNAPQFFPLAVPDERMLTVEPGSYVPDVVVVSLGTNDFNPALGPFPSRGAFVQSYVTFAQTLRRAYPSAHIFLTEGSMVADDTYGRAKSVLREYVEEVVSIVGSANVTHLPVQHQAGDSCDDHPTELQHTLMAAEVTQAIKAKLGW